MSLSIGNSAPGYVVLREVGVVQNDSTNGDLFKIINRVKARFDLAIGLEADISYDLSEEKNLFLTLLSLGEAPPSGQLSKKDLDTLYSYVETVKKETVDYLVDCRADPNFYVSHDFEANWLRYCRQILPLVEKSRDDALHPLYTNANIRTNYVDVYKQVFTSYKKGYEAAEILKDTIGKLERIRDYSASSDESLESKSSDFAHGPAFDNSDSQQDKSILIEGGSSLHRRRVMKNGENPQDNRSCGDCFQKIVSYANDHLPKKPTAIDRDTRAFLIGTPGAIGGIFAAGVVGGTASPIIGIPLAIGGFGTAGIVYNYTKPKEKQD